jgi:hypothetical protein
MARLPKDLPAGYSTADYMFNAEIIITGRAV